ncbi:hypothetical protein CHU98_g262 [Xylaria longipes]|nr:hypothetical protein CHU98_g262 [Xylaria longipes]
MDRLPIELLPIELLQEVLTHLDLKTLRNAALSCRRFFNSFKCAETLITGEVLLRQIDYDVLPEAILVSKSWNLGKPSVSREEICEFISNNLELREPAPTKWDLADALSLMQFHEKVSYLAAQAAHEAFKNEPRLTRESAEPTCAELCRFERALYRFQLYCNVLGGLPLTEDEQFDPLSFEFFDYFAPWENEQLVCIHDHFVRVVSRPFNYLVEHGITWGYLQVDYIYAFISDQAQSILAEGIEKIYLLSQASGYMQWHALLSRGEERNDEPLSLHGFLACGLEAGANPLIESWVPLGEMNEYDYGEVVEPPFYDDPDLGPETIWHLTYRYEEPGASVANPNMISSRKWAFPFWDFSRLQASGLLDPEMIWPMSFGDPELDEYTSIDREEFLDDMRRERTKIWEAGGYGWYDHDDLSQVKWIKSS